jgi:hypothetical protein
LGATCFTSFLLATYQEAQHGCMAGKFLQTIGAIALLATTGCNTANNNLAEHYKAFPGSAGLKKVPPQQVQVIVAPEGKDSGKNAAKLIDSYAAKNYASIGMAIVSGPELTEEDLREFAGAVGGDLVVYQREFMGMSQASRMVVGSYTPPSVSYGTATSYGSSYGNANTYGSTPWGNMNLSTHGSGTSYSSSRATVINPGSTTYVRENYLEQTFSHTICVLQSPLQQLRNWEIVRKNLNKLQMPGWKYETREQSLLSAAAFAQKAGVQLPKDLQPRSAKSETTGVSADL